MYPCTSVFTYIYMLLHTLHRREKDDDASSLNFSDSAGQQRITRMDDEDGDEAHPLLGQMRPVRIMHVCLYVCSCAAWNAQHVDCALAMSKSPHIRSVGLS